MMDKVRDFIDLVAWAWEYNKASFFLMLSLVFDLVWFTALLVIAIRH